MFTAPRYVFKDGELVAENGKIVKVTQGNIHIVKPDFDSGIEKQLKPFFDRYHTVKMENFKIVTKASENFTQFKIEYKIK